MVVKFSDEEFIDGCYSGIMRLHDNKDNTIEENLSFIYDIELDTIEITRRLYPNFHSPISNEWSDYMLENAWEIRHEIREQYKFKY